MDAVNELMIRHTAEVTAVGRFQMTRVGLLGVDGEPTEVEWADAGAFFQRVHDCVQWWIGDWLDYGDKRWGEKYDEAMKTTGLDYQTLRDAKWVASKFELSRRRDKVSFSHHKDTAALEPSVADAILERAEQEGMSRSELRSLVRESKATASEPRAITPGSECEAIRAWLLQRREMWPEEIRHTFVGFVSRILGRLEERQEADQ